MSAMTQKLYAAMEAIRLCGADTFELRYSGADGSDDAWPVVWVAVYTPLERLGQPPSTFECAAGPTPESAVLRLCSALIDGAICSNCGRTCMFEADSDTDRWDNSSLLIDNEITLPSTHFCLTAYEPGIARYVRSCADGENDITQKTKETPQ